MGKAAEGLSGARKIQPFALINAGMDTVRDTLKAEGKNINGICWESHNPLLHDISIPLAEGEIDPWNRLRLLRVLHRNMPSAIIPMEYALPYGSIEKGFEIDKDFVLGFIAPTGKDALAQLPHDNIKTFLGEIWSHYHGHPNPESIPEFQNMMQQLDTLKAGQKMSQPMEEIAGINDKLAEMRHTPKRRINTTELKTQQITAIQSNPFERGEHELGIA